MVTVKLGQGPELLPRATRPWGWVEADQEVRKKQNTETHPWTETRSHGRLRNRNPQRQRLARDGVSSVGSSA